MAAGTDEVEWLASAAGRALADTATAALDRGDELLAVASRLRAAGRPDPALVAAALTQAGLRRRARARFGDLADRLLWTEAGLEQATRPSVAAHRAARFALLQPRLLADLCCGVGGDLLALAPTAAATVGVDSDPVTAAVARANLATVGVPADRVRVDVADVTSYDLTGFDAAFVDPARRSGGRRTFDPSAYRPPFSYVAALASRLPAAAAKVGPGIPHDLVPAGAEAEWVSDGGDVKEAALWFGGLTGVLGPAVRRATLLPSGATLTDDPSLGRPPVGKVGRYLHEPDGAAIRAGLVAEVAHALDGRLLDPAVAYVTTDGEALSAFATRYAVDDVLPFQLKRLRAALRALDASDVVVKKRGSAIEPEELRRRLRLDGGGVTYTVLLTRTAAGPLAVIARPAPG